MDQQQQAIAMRECGAFMLAGHPARQITVSATGVTVIAADDLAAARWKRADLGCPVHVYVWRQVNAA